MTLCVILFWFSLAALFYMYLGYPLLVASCAKLLPRPVRSGADFPGSVTVVMACRGETAALAKKIRNILECRGSDLIKEILIGLDGETDSEPANFPEDPRIRIFRFAIRRGKPAVLNDLVPSATGDILLMMDVRQRLDKEAIPALLGNFTDPIVGVVSGELVFEQETADTADAASIDMYWKMEKWLRLKEAQFASVPGATGALYAIRRELARPIPTHVALDDVLIPMQAIASGYRCIFEPQARIYDRPATDAAREAVRKRRTLAGCVQLLKLHPAWVLPFGHPVWWQFGSHKIARLFSPVMLVIAAVTNGLLAAHSFYMVLAGLQTAGYLAALAGLVFVRRGPLRKLGVFLKMQGTLLQAWRDGLSGRNLALWDKA